MITIRCVWEVWDLPEKLDNQAKLKFQMIDDGFGFKSVTFQCNFIRMMVVLVNQLNFHWNFRRMMVVLVNQWIFRSNQQWCRGVWYLRQSPDQNIESRKIKRWGFYTISPSWSILSTSTTFAPQKLICADSFFDAFCRRLRSHSKYKSFLWITESSDWKIGNFSEFLFFWSSQVKYICYMCTSVL